MNFSRFPDILIISLVFIISTSLSGYLLHTILQGKDTPFLEGVEFGTAYYSIEQHGQCSGLFTVTVEDTGDKTLAILINGSVLGKFFMLTMPVSIDVKLYFNSLGQLAASVTQIDSLQKRIIAGTTHISPMLLTFRYEDPEQPFSHSFPIPGPVEVKEQDGSLSFYHKLLKSIELNPSLDSEDMKHVTSLIQSKDSADVPACHKDNRKPLDLSPFVASLNKSGILPILKRMGGL